jgi:MAE_28990/MAE_18760-like HEPN
MNDVIRVFHERKGEIDLYFEFLEDLMINDAKLAFYDGTQKRLNQSLTKILRANGFLLIYNVVESCISRGIEAIYLDIISKGLDYNAISSNIKREIIGNVKNNIKAETFVTEVTDIMIDIIGQYPKKIFSGNVDAKKIRDIAGKYGFSHQTDAEVTKNGARLVTVKEKRNDLAHGEISFQDCGKEYAIEEMIEIKNEVLQYLKEILNNIEQFLLREEYRKPLSSSTAEAD